MSTGRMAFSDLDDLSNKRVLIVEDEDPLAAEMADAVRRVGGIPLGPVPSIAAARTIIADQLVDAAILDVRLEDEAAFSIAQILRRNGMHVVFVTGHDDWYLPNELDDVPVCHKPADPDDVVQMLMHPDRAS